MSLDWSPLVELVRRHQRFLLTTHVRPDGDGLGSMLALDDVLRRLGKRVRLAISSVYPPRYHFLDPDHRIEQFDPSPIPWDDPDAVLVLDTGTWNQLGHFGPFLQTLAVPKLVIDHHVTQDDLGATRLVDTTAEATGRLIYEATRALGEPLSPRAAHCLFVALAMDTGWFRHGNTKAESFGLAQELVKAGAVPEEIYEQLFEANTLGRMKLAGVVLDRMQTAAEGRVAYTYILRSDYAQTGAVPQDSEDLVNYPRSIAGVEVGLLFMEQPRGGIKVSFRSRGKVDVARVAERFGGGGHKAASGAIVESALDDARARVLAAVAAALG